MDAINKLPYNNGRMKTINLLVFRVNIDGRLRDSKPCAHCIDYIGTVGRKKGYNVRKIYYSTDSIIVCKKISELQNDCNQHVSRGRLI
jgi:hypothetical protein